MGSAASRHGYATETAERGAEGKEEVRKGDKGRGVVAIKPPCRAPPLFDLMKTIIDWGRGEASRRRRRSETDAAARRLEAGGVANGIPTYCFTNSLIN